MPTENCGDKKQSFLLGAVCSLWAGVSMLPGKTGDLAFIHFSFIHPSIHPPATSYPSFRPPPSIRSFIHSFSALHPSILLEMLLSTYCAQTLRQAASRTSEALSDMAWCWNKDSMTEHVLCVQPHLTPRRPCVADATSMPTSQMRKLRLR